MRTLKYRPDRLFNEMNEGSQKWKKVFGDNMLGFGM